MVRIPLPRCRIPVPDNTSDGERECGEPAVAIWHTVEHPDEGVTMSVPIYVCGEHDVTLIEQQEREDEARID